MTVQINNLKEAKKYIEGKEEIVFQKKTFLKLEKFKEFINEIENGHILEMPKDSTNHTWYTNFGTIYCNKLIVTSKKLFFFDGDTLILERKRTRTDDIEYSFNKNKNGHPCSCSGNPIIYDFEQDQQYVDLHPIPKNW